MNSPTQISIKLAAALLLQRGKISVSDIRALPLVESDDAADAIVEGLTSIYNLERFQHRETPDHNWEDVFRLRDPRLEENTYLLR